MQGCLWWRQSQRLHKPHCVTGIRISSSHHHTTHCLIDHWWRPGLLDCSTVCVCVFLGGWVGGCACVCTDVSVGVCVIVHISMCGVCVC